MTRDVESEFAFPSLPLDEAKRLAALRLEHERLIAAQEDFRLATGHLTRLRSLFLREGKS